jgi:hypothetical protein
MSMPVAAPAKASPINGLPATIRETTITAGNYHACAVLASQKVRCWGDNTYNQIAVPSDLSGVVQLSAGSEHTCAILLDTTVRCWGNNPYGQIDVPENLTGVSQLSAGASHTCALRQEGNPICWGSNTFGESSIPHGLGPAKFISAGDKFTCVLKAEGDKLCWGSGYAKPFYDFETQSTTQIDSQDAMCALDNQGVHCDRWDANGTMQVPESFGMVSQYSVGFSHICALDMSGIVGCWGSHDVATEVPKDLGPVTQITSGWDFTCAVTAKGTVRCWGDNEYWRSHAPGEIGLGKIREISGGRSTACAVTISNEVLCWGANQAFQANVPKNLGPALHVSTGGQRTCAILISGGYTCWGLGGSSTTPQSIYGSISELAQGFWGLCILNSEGVAYCNSPANLGKVTHIAADRSDQSSPGSYCAIKVDGFLRCWKSPSEELAIPTDLGKVSQVDTAYGTICAIKISLTLRCWGDNRGGKIEVPKNLGEVSQVSIEYAQVCALLTSGSVTCWGGNILNSSYLRVPEGDPKVKQISEASCGVTIDNNAICWGKLQVPAAFQAPLGDLLEVATMKPLEINVEVSGKVSVGTSVSAVVRNVDSETSLTFQWYLDGSEISDAKSNSYQLTQAQFGHQISLKVTASRPGYLTTTQVTPPVSVESGRLSLTPTPTISGSGRVGERLSVTIGEWDQGVQLSKTWMRDESPIPRESSDTYLLKSTDFGHKISFRVTASLSGFLTSSSTSLQISVRAGEIKSAPTPLTSGSKTIGSILTIDTGGWDTGVALSFQWLRDGVPILGQISSTYQLKSIDFGHRVSVRVTGTMFRYSPVTLTSAEVTPELGEMSAQLPRISGNIKVGSTASFRNNFVLPGGVSRYEWLLDGKTIKGSANKSLKILPAYRGHKLVLRVSRSCSGYRSQTLSSLPVKVA